MRKLFWLFFVILSLPKDLSKDLSTLLEMTAMLEMTN